jgi:hypothetical protein
VGKARTKLNLVLAARENATIVQKRAGMLKTQSNYEHSGCTGMLKNELKKMDGPFRILVLCGLSKKLKTVFAK